MRPVRLFTECRSWVFTSIGLALSAAPASAQTVPLLLSEDLEIHRVASVGSAWQTVPIANDISKPVVVCTYVLPSDASNEAIIRLRNVGPSSFELRAQRFENSAAVTTSEAHCLVARSGAHSLPDGRAFEAGTILSDATSGNTVGWDQARSERVDTALVTSFASPVVLASVMSFNDARASAVFSWNGASRGAPPTGSAIWLGKHIGQINGSRSNEILGYIVFEAGSGTSNGLSYTVQLGADTIGGVGNSPPYSYGVSGDLDMAVLSQAGEDGGHGGWAVLYGADPLPAGSLRAAIDEETVAGDTSRNHTTEQVAFIGVARAAQQEAFDLDKSVIVHPDSSSDYNVPGSDVLYTLTFENVGTGMPDQDTLFLYDTVPPELTFVNGDANGSGVSGTDPVAVTLGADSGLSVASIGYRNAASAPGSIGDCTDGPGPNVRHVCVALDGYALPGSLYSDVAVEIAFRARVR